jgi:hypothetical protein
MRQVTEKIVGAFLRNEYRRIGNTWTDGRTIWLHGHAIAEFRTDGLWITNAGWPTPTTKERLNGIPDVSIVQKKGQWYLNGQRRDLIDDQLLAIDGAGAVRISARRGQCVTSHAIFVEIKE